MRRSAAQGIAVGWQKAFSGVPFSSIEAIQVAPSGRSWFDAVDRCSVAATALALLPLIVLYRIGLGESASIAYTP
jgi:hypothetical protein